MAHVVLDVTNEHGLHARPATLFVQRAAKFSSTIWLRNLSKEGKEVNAKSIMQLLTAGVDTGSKIELRAEGEDADQAVEELATLIREGLGAGGTA